MISNIYLGLILVFFILAFALRNIKTYLAVKQPIRGQSKKLSASVLLSSLIYLFLLLRLTGIIDAEMTFEFNLPRQYLISSIGFLFVSTGFLMGIFALIAMKNSWRVGIKYDQKTDLVTTGIYRFSRNPYFFSYDILILGFIMLFPSLILLFLYIPLVVVFHFMILEEEKYLSTVQGQEYQDYKNKTGRYLSI